MAETGNTGEISGEVADLTAQLNTLRASGAAERDPVRFAYIEALARRAATQPPAIRQSLAGKISTAAGELAARPGPPPAGIAKADSVSPLAGLLAYISQHAQTGAKPPTLAAAAARHSGKEDTVERLRQHSPNASSGRSPQAPELKSVAYFRQEWSKLSTEQQLTQTLAQAPENAGPMNSQHLVLRSLQTMRDIAPDYLQGFMSYIDTLIWLEHADPTKIMAVRSSGSDGGSKARTAKRGTKNR